MNRIYYFRRRVSEGNLSLDVVEYHRQEKEKRIKMRASVMIPAEQLNDDTEATFLKHVFDLNGIPLEIQYIQSEIPENRLLRFFAFLAHHNVKTLAHYQPTEKKGGTDV